SVVLAACATPTPEIVEVEVPGPERTVVVEVPAEPGREQVTLSLILVSPAERWEALLPLAEEVFEAENPDIDVVLDPQILPFGDRLTLLRAMAVAGTPLDIVSLDQPEVGEFAAAGFTSDLTDRINADLDGLSDWLPAHRAATLFEGGSHAIWAWTDARVLWYWKDLVEGAGVDPATDMVTWDGYIESCQALDGALAGQGIEGCLLIGQPWIADWTLPYAWMSGGDLGFDVNTDVAADVGAAEAWIPAFDSQAWVDALQFTRDQVDAGIDPFTEHQFGPAFADRRYATWLGGTWVFGRVRDSGADMSNVGLVGAFPVPTAGTATATMAGGWTLAIPSTSRNPDVAWEFLKAMLRQDTVGSVQTSFGYLPTQESFAEGLAGEFESFWNEGGVDRWSEMQALAPNAYGRPSFPTWPQIGQAITDMVQRVMFEAAAPAASAAEAQRTTLADVLGWPAGTTAELHDDAAAACEHGDVDRLISAVTPVQRDADANGNGSICSHVNLP
ncbi:MAG: extracellular solute-binding protein, partial [Anaerolineae bacterium]